MKKIAFSFFILLFSLASYALGDKPGKGLFVNVTVIDKQSGEAIAGAKIEVKGAEGSFYSDLDGHLIIQARSGVNTQVLVSMAGYEPALIRLADISASGLIELASR